MGTDASCVALGVTDRTASRWMLPDLLESSPTRELGEKT